MSDLYEPAEFAARQAEIVGRPPRIDPLQSEALGPDLRAAVEAIHGSLGLTTPPVLDDYFCTLARNPAICRPQLELGAALFQGRLPARDRELAVLRIGWMLGAPYEWGEHVAIAYRCAVSAEEIERIIQGSRAPGWSAHDAAILAAVEQMLSRYAVADETWAVLARSWDDAQLVEFTTVVAQYAATGLIQNTLRIRLTDTNPGLTQR